MITCKVELSHRWSFHRETGTNSGAMGYLVFVKTYHVYFFMWECVLELLDPMEFLGNLNCWCYFVCPIFFENEKGFWLEEYSNIFLLFSRYNHLMFADYREPLVEVAAQLLVVLLDHDSMQPTPTTMNGTDTEHSFEVNYIF